MLENGQTKNYTTCIYLCWCSHKEVVFYANTTNWTTFYSPEFSIALKSLFEKALVNQNKFLISKKISRSMMSLSIIKSNFVHKHSRNMYIEEREHTHSTKWNSQNRFCWASFISKKKQLRIEYTESFRYRNIFRCGRKHTIKRNSCNSYRESMKRIFIYRKTSISWKYKCWLVFGKCFSILSLYFFPIFCLKAFDSWMEKKRNEEKNRIK